MQTQLHFICLIRNFRKGIVRLNWVPKWDVAWKMFENHWFRGSTRFHSKNVGEPIEYSRCLPLPCFNKFILTQKKFNCFIRYKTIPTLNFEQSFFKTVFQRNSFLQNFIKNNLCKVSRRRARDRDETWDLRDRDSKKRVSRRVSTPRPSLETPSLASNK